MAKEQKTKPLEMTAEEYIQTLETDKQKEEARTLIPIFERATGEPAVVRRLDVRGHHERDGGDRHPAEGHEGHPGSPETVGDPSTGHAGE